MFLVADGLVFTEDVVNLLGAVSSPEEPQGASLVAGEAGPRGR